MKDIYTIAVKKLPASDLDHHGTDLYIKSSAAAAALVAEYDFLGNVEIFRSPLDGCAWYDIPFAYTPAWIEKLNRRPVDDVISDYGPLFDTLSRRGCGEA
ncbi:MAG: hypothetical protein J6S14_11925 [Clostridia bacterium]|nr:hypothetical protein [Clostridia bacterium]